MDDAQTKKVSIQSAKPNEIRGSVEGFHTGLSQYLAELSLPNTNILVPVEERAKVFNNVHSVTASLPAEMRRNAMYLSKFVAASAVGLFDAALNFLWNETVNELRKRIVGFNLDYYLDSTIQDTERRKKIRTEEDLKKIEDWELIKGCAHTGIISEVGLKHLDYIRDMRNHISAAHPNQNSISGLQLISWLETCIIEVLSKPVDAPVLEIKRLLNNIRNQEFTHADIKPILSGLGRLKEEVTDSLLKTLFGMSSDPNLPATARNNVSLIVTELWPSAPEQAKYNIGLYHANLAANGDIERKNRVHGLLQTVNGLSYLPESNLALEMQQSITGLMLAHNGFNNFYNEPAHVRILRSYVPESGKVPKSIEGQYVKALVMCKIGNGYGVSSAAEQYYDDLLGRFSAEQVLRLIAILATDSELAARLQFSSCAIAFRELLGTFGSRINDARVSQCIELVGSYTNEQFKSLYIDSRFKEGVKKIYSR